MKKLNLFFILIFSFLTSKSQDTDSLLNSLNKDSTAKYNEFTIATFKATNIVLSQSVETQKKHNLNFAVKHRFGDIGGEFGGSHTLWGLDVASDLFLGLDYGITNDLTVGVGRSRNDELFNFLLKYRLLKQKTDNSMPVSVTLFAQNGWKAREEINVGEFKPYSNRFSYVLQAIIARKFSQAFSIQVSPTYLIRPVADDTFDDLNIFSLGFAGRLKLTKRFSLIADYQWVNGLFRPSNLSTKYYNPLGVGVEIETGGHIFALNFMNSESIIENNFLANTQKSWGDGGVRFGFTIARNFTLFKSKNKEIQTKIY